MPTLVRALVKPELLIWARESARLSVEQAAQKAQVKPPGRLVAWERGESQPTIGELRKLARVYKRPLAVFYLSERPKAFQAMNDFRRLPEEMVGLRLRSWRSRSAGHSIAVRSRWSSTRSSWVHRRPLPRRPAWMTTPKQ
jgi:transcriptional regulator with XRE-family HTH domain